MDKKKQNEILSDIRSALNGDPVNKFESDKDYVNPMKAFHESLPRAYEVGIKWAGPSKKLFTLTNEDGVTLSDYANIVKIK